MLPRRSRYFEHASAAKPFLSVVRAIITNELGQLVEASDLKKWEETLAILSTYGKSDEFPALCEMLGGRLERETRDATAAALCYMCAVNVPKTVAFWVDTFRAASQKLGKVDTVALQDLVEKVTIFARDESGKCDPSAQLAALGPEIVDLFTNYAGLLASQGQSLVAAKYCGQADDNAARLLDRLYRSSGPHYDHAPPPFPVAQIHPSSAITGVVPAGYAPTEEAPHGAVAAAATTNGAAHHAGAGFDQQPAFQPTATAAAQQPAFQPQHHQPLAAPQGGVPQTNGAALPYPWKAIQDPSSGRTYYANTESGATQWEPPAAPAAAPKPKPKPAPAPAPVPVPMPARTQPAPVPAAAAPQPVAHAPQPNPPQPATFAPRANNPPQPVPQPNLMPAPVPQPQPAPAPPPAPAPAPAPEPVPVAQSPEAVAVAENLSALVAHLGGMPLNGSEKRQLAEVDKSVTVLKQKMTFGAVDANVVASCHHLVGAMLNRDYATAQNVQVALVNSHWGEHKDWLKGVKFLIQLAQKKM